MSRRLVEGWLSSGRWMRHDFPQPPRRGGPRPTAPTVEELIQKALRLLEGTQDPMTARHVMDRPVQIYPEDSKARLIRAGIIEALAQSQSGADQEARLGLVREDFGWHVIATTAPKCIWVSG